MKDQIIFDTTDANTIADSDKILSGLVSSSDGATLLTDTLEGGKQGLDVFVINADLDVNLQDGAGNDITSTGGALDVNIASGTLALASEYDEDSAHTSGDKGVFTMSVRVDDLTAVPASVLADTEGDYQAFITDATGALYVAGNQLDIDDLNATDDEVSIGDGTNSISLTAAGEVKINDNGGSITVDATDLDIRSLDHTSGGANDSVRLGDGTDFITSTLEGGKQALDVYVANDIDVDDGIADTAIANAVNTLTTGGTAEDAVASPLASRKYLYVYNNDNRRMFIGGTGVTSANGFPVAPRAYMELRAGPSLDVEFVSPKTGHEIRTLEMS